MYPVRSLARAQGASLKDLGGATSNGMYNWSTQQEELEKTPRKYAIWKLEQIINFGLDGQKINIDELKKYWSEIEIDPARRKFLEMIINE